ncbi:glycosyltransferase [Vibrio splendidus]
MHKFILLCVIYNKKCNESDTITSFYRSSYHSSSQNDVNIELHIWDNSTDKSVLEHNRDYCEKKNIYHHFNGNNEFLSVVYNKFLHRYKDDFLMIFDDDSNVSNEYLESVVKTARNVDFHVGVPKIESQLKSIYSPAKFGLVKGRHLDDISCGFNFGLVAISSGMVINCKKVTSKGIYFDENLNLYGIDTDFFLYLARRGISLYVLDVSIIHDLSCFNVESSQVKKKRLLNLIKSNIYIARKRSIFHFIAFLIYTPLVLIKNIRLFIT